MGLGHHRVYANRFDTKDVPYRLLAKVAGAGVALVITVLAGIREQRRGRIETTET